MTVSQASAKSTPTLALVVGIASALAPNIMPLLVSVSSRAFHLTAAAAGRITAVEMLGFTLGSVAISILLPRLAVSRPMLVALLGIIATNLLTVAFGAHALLPLRFVAGVGEGAGTAAMTAILAASGAPARYFGLFLCISFGIAMVLFRVDSLSNAVAGPYAMYWILAGACLLALPAAISAKRSSEPAQLGPGVVASIGRTGLVLVALTLVGIVIYFAAWTTIWAYAVDVCHWSGLSPQGCAAVLSYAVIAGAAGAALAVFLGPRLGNLIPLLIASAIMAASAILIIVKLSPGIYPIAILGWMGGVQFAAPYLVAIASEADRGGRAASLSVGAQTLGMAIGPALGATVVDRSDAALLAWMAIALLVPGLAAALAVARRLSNAEKSVMAGSAKRVAI
jgi:predicted MFS family arabinose efflux permease